MSDMFKRSCRKKAGQLLTAAGVALVLAAVCLAVYNVMTQRAAQEQSDALLRDVKSAVSAPEGLPAGTVVDYVPAEKNPLADGADSASPPEESSQKIKPKNVSGMDVVGFVEIPSLDVELPVTSDWSYKLMKKAACRYSGEPCDGNLIICAHNYSDFFGRLDTLNSGDIISFVSMDGIRYNYEVTQTELLSGNACEEMSSGDWDLTLFTCTWSGQKRVTVRARMVISAG